MGAHHRHLLESRAPGDAEHGELLRVAMGPARPVKTAAIELGPHNITVNAVCPTMTETPQVTNDVLYRMFRPDLENPTKADVEEMVMAHLHKLPTPWVQPEDISNAMLFLAPRTGASSPE
jgi:NAD(P)-dependent dehydrogenase (short-subunit alcohol dehydrogenase family)